MIEQIKEIVKNYLNTIKPARLLFATIESISPLSLRIDDKLVIPEELIIWAPALEASDSGKSVLLIQQEGGQQFYILEVRQ